MALPHRTRHLATASWHEKIKHSQGAGPDHGSAAKNPLLFHRRSSLGNGYSRGLLRTKRRAPVLFR
ncbi:hypothetical protein PUN4_120043 [Paraburkholderia unamae]|nr:hypothetical protein PUN4_120043 [Paraburkholderia unamae]